MSWLIESYMIEEMKTASDFNRKKMDEFQSKSDKVKKAADRFKRMNPNDIEKNMSEKDMHNMIHNMGEQIKAQDAANSASERWDIESGKKHLNKSLKYGDKNADIVHKVDAISRHNRRHPDAKVTNESVSDIVELLQ